MIFQDGKVQFLICTDVAARGIDVKGVPFGKYKILHSLYKKTFYGLKITHCKYLETSRYRTEFAKKGFYYAAVKLWNLTSA